MPGICIEYSFSSSSLLAAFENGIIRIKNKTVADLTSLFI
nr:hypothetical protein [Klebsiella michiganensis]